ncbi:gamma-glutamyltransferase [Halovulum dunhuangense]|uniref:Gamma-glutamyltransferase n=1 Tax=Halovulum dunhuangense TaxID=1505036 RepID=A0A849L784_9RHOB|nr:gamma-glutamyltransferase [Halovulum dunhuangense]NNU81970.1 gamma-glutamyltransferase [Halovulum dunhuangense]
MSLVQDCGEVSTPAKGAQARGTPGALTTPHPLATAAGMRVLEAGGTAPEALIAAGAVLAVVMPHFCGLGGDAVWLVSDRHGRQRSFLAIGQGIDRPMPAGPFPLRGPGSILTTAAVVDGWRHAFEDARATMGATAGWEDLLAPAAGIAADGHEVTRSQAFWAGFRAPDCGGWPGFGRIFLGDGQPLPAGHVLRQPELARTLSDLAERGPREFYTGPLARRIVEGLRAEGVVIGAHDLARTTTRQAAPLALDYRGLTLLAPPPPTQGVTTLQIMGILSRFDLARHAPGSAGHVHLCVEAVKRAFLHRHAIADPAFARADTGRWLGDAALDAEAGRIATDRAMPWPHRWQHGDTVFLGAIDAQGNAASVLQSTYFDWGSGVVAGDTGILWQNRGAAFSSDPASPNAFAPGKLPFYTLNPGLALKDGQPHIVYGTQGADGQPQTLAMLLTRLIDFAQTPEDALAGPRFLLGRTFSDSRDSLKIEADAGAQVLSDLAALGHEISPIPAQSPIAGQAGLVVADGMGCHARHDPRQ